MDLAIYVWVATTGYQVVRWIILVSEQLVSVFVDNELFHVGSHEALWHAMLILSLSVAC